MIHPQALLTTSASTFISLHGYQTKLGGSPEGTEQVFQKQRSVRGYVSKPRRSHAQCTTHDCFAVARRSHTRSRLETSHSGLRT